MSTTLSALNAALQILLEADKPLHYKEITERALAAGLWQTTGKTPAATINAQLATHIKKHGATSTFRRAGPGLYALNTNRPSQSSEATPPLRPKPARSASSASRSPRARRKNSTLPLVLGYIERIASNAFSDYPRQITDLAHGKHGVYALYKGDRLYYVGLATNLRNRIKQHLRDRHAGKWDRFSLYLVRNVEHIRELESIILRIADPTGNATRGTLPGAENLRAPLQRSIREEQDRQNAKLFGLRKSPRPRPSCRRTPPQKHKPSTRKPSLAAYLDKGISEIRATYKKQALTARVKPDGSILFNGKTYNSPSIAGAAAVQRKTCNGWTFWKYEQSPGNWVLLDNLRK